ncbi:MAG: hypothetical protein GX488_06400 [Clostridiales bacterium]|nr:hypothetical protein [Clostridiales bacterium]
MLGKLIKYDFRSLSRILFPTQIAMLGATIIATLGFLFNVRIDLSGASMNGGIGLLRIIIGFLSGIMVLGIIAASFLVAFIIFQRFYKSLMSDEGYLTFTLPVTTTDILWSKLITAMLWTIISGVVIFICINIFLVLGTSRRVVFNFEIYREISRFIHEAFQTIGGKLTVPMIEFVLLSLVSLAYSILHVYLALIIGGIVSQKHKVLAGIGFYFAISMIVGTISSVVQYFIGEPLLSRFNALEGVPFDSRTPIEIYDIIFSASQPYYWFMLIFMLALSAAFFILCHYLLKNKLNLE